MTSWEHTRIRMSEDHAADTDIDTVNQLGRQGWELVAVGHLWAWLKRPIPVPPGVIGGEPKRWQP